MDRLLSGEELARLALDAVRVSESEIYLVSAFLKEDVVSWLENAIPEGVTVRLLSRWRKVDLVSGASDLEVFTLARKRRWRLFVDFDLHTKALLVDKNQLFLGSSNYTGRGLGLFGKSNKELNIAVVPNAGEVERIKGYFDDAYEMNFPMYSQMRDELSQTKTVLPNDDSTWSSELTECFKPIVEKIWATECLTVGPSKYFANNADRGNFDCDIWRGKEASVGALKSARIFKWLENELRQSAGNPRFGELTARLHDALINDPKPYRKEVKDYLRVLIEWVQYFELFETVRHNITVSIVNPYAEA